MFYYLKNNLSKLVSKKRLFQNMIQQLIMLQQYVISTDARLRSRNSTVSVKAETAECLVAQDPLIA